MLPSRHWVPGFRERARQLVEQRRANDRKGRPDFDVLHCKGIPDSDGRGQAILKPSDFQACLEKGERPVCESSTWIKSIGSITRQILSRTGLVVVDTKRWLCSDGATLPIGHYRRKRQDS